MLNDLENNLKVLISAYETQKARAEGLEEELSKCRNQLNAAKNKINELEDKVDNLNLRSAFTSSRGHDAQAEARIDMLIKEIDKALAMLQ